MAEKLFFPYRFYYLKYLFLWGALFFYLFQGCSNSRKKSLNKSVEHTSNSLFEKFAYNYFEVKGKKVFEKCDFVLKKKDGTLFAELKLNSEITIDAKGNYHGVRTMEYQTQDIASGRDSFESIFYNGDLFIRYQNEPFLKRDNFHFDDVFYKKIFLSVIPDILLAFKTYSEMNESSGKLKISLKKDFEISPPEENLNEIKSYSYFDDFTIPSFYQAEFNFSDSENVPGAGELKIRALLNDFPFTVSCTIESHEIGDFSISPPKDFVIARRNQYYKKIKGIIDQLKKFKNKNE